jgi:hypothetical protein
MDEPLGLLDEGFGDGRMRVAQAANRNAAAQIQITPPIQVEQLAAASVAERQVETAVAGHNIPVKQFANRGNRIFHVCRRCRHDIFHFG